MPTPFATIIKALVIALVIALLAYLFYPAAGLTSRIALDFALIALISGIATAIITVFMPTTIRVRAPSSNGETQALFVGNLAFKATEEELRELFGAHGTVLSVRILRDRKTRRPRGYGFVEMPRNHGRRAIKALDGKEFQGRKLRVREGNPREERDDNGQD